jgi:hypothetical protein
VVSVGFIPMAVCGGINGYAKSSERIRALKPNFNAKVIVKCPMRTEEIDALLSESDRLPTLHRCSDGRMNCVAERARKSMNFIKINNVNPSGALEPQQKEFKTRPRKPPKTPSWYRETSFGFKVVHTH